MTIVDNGWPAGVAGPAEQGPAGAGVTLDDDYRRQLAAALDRVRMLVAAPEVRWPDTADGPGWAGLPDYREHPGRRVVRRGGLEVDLARCRARWRGSRLALTQRERTLLACLAGEPVRVWTYRELYAAAWPAEYLDPGPVHAAIKRLRRKLREAGATVLIEAVRGIGYELVETD
jgi:DNA-binding response OmpR family regulator